MKQIHRFTGIFIAIFVSVHLFNHVMAVYGIETHQSILETLRAVYRIPIIEILLIASFAFQSISGFILFRKLWKKENRSVIEKMKMYSGLILGLFIIQHVGATIGSRLYFDFDTNFYFAANVVLEKPFLYYFIPYYFLGIMAFALHVASVHKEKVSPIVGERNANIHFALILLVFFAVAIIILYVFSGGLYEFDVPEKYKTF